MRPLKVLKHQTLHGMDFVADCVLDLISDYTNITPTQVIIDECLKDKVSSQGTTHRKLALLKSLGLVAEHVHPSDGDGRKCFIKVTEKGLRYLITWEKTKGEMK